MQERIVGTADQLFYTRGIQAVGVDLIAAEVGISKRTLYNHFASKGELVLAYLERRDRPTAAMAELSPADQILAEFDRLEASLAADGFRGCPFVNAVAEVAEPADVVGAIAARFKERRRQWFRSLLRKLEVAEPEELAVQMMLLVDGAVAATLVGGVPGAGRAARNAAAALLAGAGASVTGGKEGQGACSPGARKRRGDGRR